MIKYYRFILILLVLLYFAGGCVFDPEERDDRTDIVSQYGSPDVIETWSSPWEQVYIYVEGPHNEIERQFWFKQEQRGGGCDTNYNIVLNGTYEYISTVEPALEINAKN